MRATGNSKEMVDALVDSWHSRKIKQKAKLEQENAKRADKFDRDNIDVPVIVEEKRSIVVSDPGFVHSATCADVLPNSMSLHSGDETRILTMKKVSSLALV